MAPSRPKNHLSTTEVARYCAVDRRTVLRWVDSGILPSFQTGGGRNRIRTPDLVRFMQDRGMPIPRELDAARRRILVVDDDPLHVSAMRRLLSRWFPEADVREATDGFSAGVVVTAFRPHVLLLDVLMPGMDGREVCGRIRAERDLDGVRIVVVSGILDAELEAALLEVGADHCLRKPVEPPELERLLRAYLERDAARAAT